MATPNTPAKVVEITSARSCDISFEDNTVYRIAASDFEECTLTGVAGEYAGLGNKNFHSCSIRDIDFLDVDFDSCDFLDTYISNATFSSCELKGAHFNTCEISESRFIDCTMEWTNHNGTIFRDCTFERCDFVNILIKNCEFIECSFVGGSTTNKLFESCIILDCQFDSLPLQVQTITENIGLRKNQFRNTLFRTARKRDPHSEITIEDISLPDSLSKLDSISRFSWFYFLYGMTIESYEVVFEITENPDWLSTKIPTSLAIRTENLISFMQYIYERNELMYIVLLRFRDFFQELCNHLNQQPEISQQHIARVFNGIRMSLVRYADEFLRVALQVVATQGHELRFDANGPVSVEYFEAVFDHLVGQGYIKINSVRPRNSPVEVIATLLEAGAIWFVVATVLSTRIRYDFSQTRETQSDSASQQYLHHGAMPHKSLDKASAPDSTRTKKVTIRLGPLASPDEDYVIEHLSVFSNGITKSLKISFSAKRALRIHNSIIRLLKGVKDSGDDYGK